MTKTITLSPSSAPGRDSENLQQAIDQLSAAGGGALEIPAGTYLLSDALHLRSGVHLRGEKGAILQRVVSVASPILDFLGYGHYEFRVRDPELFRVGMGVHIRDDKAQGFYTTQTRIIARQGDLFFVERMFNHDYLPFQNAIVESVFSVLEIADAQDCSARDLVLDGNEQETRGLNGCRGGGVFAIQSRNVQLVNLEIRHYCGDALSFQQCADVVVENCHLHHNTGGGLHPGSGSVRYRMDHNRVHDNGGCGLFYCLRTTHGLCRNNTITDNALVGISVGERDTDQLIQGNTVRGNGREGLLFRKPVARSGDRVRVLDNRIGGNCLGGKSQCEVFIHSGLEDIHLAGNEIEPGPGKTGFHVEPGCRRISAVNNRISGKVITAGDIAGDAANVLLTEPAQLPPVGPSALPLDGARHLGWQQPLPVTPIQ